MNPITLKPGIYWVGAIDWNLRSFHGYATDRGGTYNAYLVVDEKIALIDAVKAPFVPELISRVEKILPLEKIDYLVANHVEMDHSGGIPQLLARMPKAQVVASQPQGVQGLTLHYGELNFHPVKAGDTLSLGKRTLTFIPTPMLHWPDNMLTYCPEEGVLFSNDAFGQHYATSGRFDDEVSLDITRLEAAKYYANIVMPYPSQVKGALKALNGVPVDLIAPSHGVIWRSYIPEILADYTRWSDNRPPRRGLVIYDTMWHSTEAMATAIAEAWAAAGVPSKLLNLSLTELSDVMSEVLEAQYLAVGSPTLNNNMMPTVAAFLAYLRGLAPKGRKAMAFGSYGWSGQSIGLVEQGLRDAGLEIFCEMQRQRYIPSEESLAALEKAAADGVDAEGNANG